jgi:hypothetical protein
LKFRFNRLFLVFILYVNLSYGSSFVTVELSGGRMGDCLMSVIYALWASYKTGAKAAYKPFPYSDKFVFSHKVQSNDSIRLQRSKVNVLNEISSNAKRLYILPYFSQVYQERRLPWNSHWINMDIDWEEPGFKKHLREMIAPVENLNLINPPKDCISVALHWRRGGEHDGDNIFYSETDGSQKGKNYVDYLFGLKFPPRNFYVDSLKHLACYLDKQPMYVYIFTDDHNPQALADYLSVEFKDFPNIQFDCRASGNNETSNVVEDFFSLTKFDCIIHPVSSFSIIAGKIGNFKVEIFPEEFHWEGNRSIMDLVKWIIR